MSSTSNNKSKTKKKKKVTARQLKRVNADRKKFGVLRSSESSRPPAASSEALLSSPSPTVLPSNFNQLLPKRKKFNAVSDSNIIIDIRSLPKDTKDMLPTIQKQVLNNFATNYYSEKKKPNHLDLLLLLILPPIRPLLKLKIIYFTSLVVHIYDV